MCVVPVRGVHCWDWGGQAEQETVVGTRGQQENYLLGLGNNCEQDLMKTGTVPYQLYQQHRHSYALTLGWHWG